MMGTLQIVQQENVAEEEARQILNEMDFTYDQLFGVFTQCLQCQYNKVMLIENTCQKTISFVGLSVVHVNAYISVQTIEQYHSVLSEIQQFFKQMSVVKEIF